MINFDRESREAGTPFSDYYIVKGETHNGKEFCWVVNKSLNATLFLFLMAPYFKKQDVVFSAFYYINLKIQEENRV